MSDTDHPPLDQQDQPYDRYVVSREHSVVRDDRQPPIVEMRETP